jgi:DNA-binding protein Fis
MTPDDLPAELRAMLEAAGVTDEASLQQAMADNPELQAQLTAFLQEQMQAQADAAMTQLFADLPADLRARLDAAGAVDARTLQQAVEQDAQLKADFEAFLAERRAAAQPQILAQYLDAFAAVADGQQLASLWAQIPTELEQPFLDAVEQRIAAAEQSGAAEQAEGLRQRRDGLQQMLDQTSQAAERIARDVARLEAATDDQTVAEVWNQVPLELEDTFLSAAEQRLAELGATPEAAQLQQRIAMLREVRQQREEFERQPPVVKAAVRFLQVERDDQARQVFAEQAALLQPYEAQQLADGLVAQAPPELRERFAGRAALLRELRGAIPQTEQPVSAPATTMSLEAERSTTLIDSAQATDGGSATVYNITNISVLKRQWERPAAPPLKGEFIARHTEIAELRDLLQSQGEVAIGGRTVGVQGMAGVGKTVLANLLAIELQDMYPDGVLWQVIGPDRETADQAQDILDEWGLRAVGVDFDPDHPPRFEASAVRALLSQHPQLLVVLDNVWSSAAIAPLREALPHDAHLVVTTRSRRVLESLRGRPFLLDVLSPNDAQALVALRLGWNNGVPDQDQAWVADLIEGVGRHTLALDVALGVLRLEGETAADWTETAARITNHLRDGKGFDDLRLDEHDREHHVEQVLQYSYAHTLDETARRRFRLLGAFAPDAEFSTTVAAAVWDCPEDEARRSLNGFVNSALLSRGGTTGRWQQHALLRGYALALLHRAGEYEATAAQHAQRYGDAIRTADNSQQFALMRPDMPQLRHAFAWAVQNDLSRAQGLIGDCAELQAAFGMSREALSWCEAALAAAQQRGTSADIARAWGSLGNARGRVATLGGENRRERLLAALAAYDEALRFRTPESAPLAYAMTQNNRANRLSEIATLAGENRRERLLAALAAYDEALRFYTPESAPLAYAMTQNNRANRLSEIATLAGENRRERLLAALAAYDEALRFYTPESAPLAYAMTQNNRANILSEIATLAGENRRERLLAALAAYDEALRFYTPESAPLAYAMTQNNRANILSEIATLAGENRRERLLAALAAYDEALRFRTPESAPLAYAMTQNNRANRLSEIATLAGENHRERLLAALAALDEALRFYTPESAPLAYAMTQNNRATILSDIATLAGENRRERLLAALAALDEALRFYTPESAPLDYAMTQNNRATILSDIATLAGENRRERLLAALAALDEALRFYTPESAPLAYAMTQNNRANRLSEIATLAGENRRERLLAALAALDEALRFRTPESAPLAYASTQNNRANRLSEIATLAGENRRERLLAALAAYDEALRFRTPESAPLDYASTQNNRANILSEIATLAGENRRERLLAALAALDEALRFRTPESAPLAYAMTQNNRANILSEIATLAGENRRERLLAALAAYDEALRFRTPESAPLDYASTQNNRANILSEIATLAGENRRERLLAALAALDEALRFRTPESAPLDYASTQGNLVNLHQAMTDLSGEHPGDHWQAALLCGLRALEVFTNVGHAEFQQRAMHQLRKLRQRLGSDFRIYWEALNAGPLPDWLDDPADHQSSPTLPTDLQARLQAAGVTDAQSFQHALEADPELARDYQAFLEANPAMVLQALIGALLQVADSQALLAFWQQVPSHLEQPLIEQAEQMLAQARQSGDENLAMALEPRLTGLKQIREARQAEANDPARQAFQAALTTYLEQVQAAEANPDNLEAWQAAVAAGEALLAPELAATPDVNWEALRANLASVYNRLSITQETSHNLEASLAAIDRAIALQPDEAMWRRNRSGTLIDLGRLDEATEELERARALEPEAPRLAQLQESLDQARNPAPDAGEDTDDGK